MILAHIEVISEQPQSSTSTEAKSQLFVNYFYSPTLSLADKLAILIIYFEKCRRQLVEFNCNDLNFFLDTINTQKDKHMDDFFYILTANAIEHVSPVNVEQVTVIFQRLLKGVAEESSRKRRGLKSMVLAETVKKTNRFNREMLAEFVNSL